jgi:hypothetical protein
MKFQNRIRPNRASLLLACFAAMAMSPLAFAQHHDMLGMMDSNGDGQVSAAEHAAAAQAMFDKADANHDGNLTADEMMAAHGDMGAPHAMAGHHAMAEAHAMAEGGKKMACDCCGKGEGGEGSCGKMDKHDPVGDAMAGHGEH